MGTSTSSKGGSAGSPFDPAWLTPDNADSNPPRQGDETVDSDSPSSDDAATGDSASTSDSPAEAPEGSGDFAPDRRFASARTKMSDYLSGGGRESLRAAAKSMVNKGMGGPRQAASTMRATSKGAGQLGQFLASARNGTDPRVVDWVQRVREANLSADDLILELVKEVLPDTGSVDDESLRNAAAEALAKLYENTPEVDVLNLTDDQIAEVIGYTIANDVCNRMDLQLGQTYERLKFDPQQVQIYRNDVKEFVRSEVKVVIERQAGLHLDPQQLSKEILASTLEVFAQ